MALDLNATPDDQGDEGADDQEDKGSPPNQPPANEQDRSIHDPLEAVGACGTKRGTVPALLLQPAVEFDDC